MNNRQADRRGHVGRLSKSLLGALGWQSGMVIVALSLEAWGPWSMVLPSVLGHQPSDG